MPRKTVAIRGLDTELYHEVFSMAKKDGRRVSDVVNVALKAYIDGDANGDSTSNSSLNLIGDEDFVLSIDEEGNVSLSKNDILELSEGVGGFAIRTSGNLIFEKDVDGEALSKINNIFIKSGTVKISYPSLLMKAQINGALEKY
jgi:hypothetical protein